MPPGTRALVSLAGSAPLVAFGLGFSEERPPPTARWLLLTVRSYCGRVVSGSLWFWVCV